MVGGQSRNLDKILLNPKRFMIATILYIRGPSIMSELQRILDISWGDLDSSIRKMKDEGYVEMRKIITPLGPRTQIRLTPLGYRRYEALLEALEEIIKGTRTRGRKDKIQRE